MEPIKIYIHAENERAPKFVEIPSDATITDIIATYRQAFPEGGSADEIELFIEDQDGAHEKARPGHEIGVRHRGHIHCHRCKQVEVSIIYNGDDKCFHFAPSMLARKVLKKAIEAFHISEHDAGDYQLKLDDKTILDPADHIGSFTAYPRCHVKLFLTAKKPIQG